MNVRVKAAADYVGLSKSSLDKMRCLGTGPLYFKVGRAVVYSHQDLDAWLESQKRVSTWGANDNLSVAHRVAA